jgi:hypothetical protein
MINNEGILEKTSEQLFRPTAGQVRFSDVYSEVVGEHEESWWRKTDFDGELTDEVESAGFPKVKQIPIGLRPWFASYGLVLTDDLVRAHNERVLGYGRADTQVHQDILREIKESRGAILALANYAPRDDANTENDSNGSDFYLAITDSGLEIYTTPLSFLSDLDARNRITALYQIPTKGHPEFNGDYEQFRSARVVRTRRHPEHLVPIFEYETQADLVKAKEDGSHEQIIPVDPRTGQFAFVDHFGNIKLGLSDIRVLRKLQVGRFASLVVKNQGQEYEIGVQAAENLHTAPLGKFAVYTNCSDFQDTSSNTGFGEFAVRVNGNPTTSTNTAIFQLLKQIPDLDPATAEVALVA